MIPRLRPPFSLGDLLSAASAPGGEAEAKFERAFAERFGFEYGLFFPYGRSAMYALLRALGWRDAEVVMPAYTCVVVAHATTLSGNRARFVDAQSDHFNVAPDALGEALSGRPRMIVPTPLFGYPIDRPGYEDMIQERAPDAFVLYDVAHAFGVADEQGPQTSHADGALFGLGIGKILSSLYGGMLLLRDEALHKEVRDFRNREFRNPGFSKRVERLLYGLATWGAFRQPGFAVADFLEHHTHALDGVTEYYYGKGGPTLPEDVTERPTAYQAQVGLRQLNRYEGIVAERRRLSQRYETRLRAEGFFVFESHALPTYSHFPFVVADRDRVVAQLRARGVQVGILVDYACPALPGYEEQRQAGAFPHAEFFGSHMINLPNWPGMTLRTVDAVVDALCQCRDANADLFRTG